MNERVKRWIIEAHRRGESLDAMRVQVRNTFDTELTFWEIRDVCNEADTGMRCVCGYTGSAFIKSGISTRVTSVYACPECGTLKVKV
jgi:hypothetical protein